MIISVKVGRSVGFARDKNGIGTNCLGNEACSWCALGAITAAYAYSNSEDDESYQIDKLLSIIRTESIAKWNDAPERTQAEVIAAFEQAGI